MNDKVRPWSSAPNQSISAQTRRRVLDAARELGYLPYAPARALRSNRSDMVLYLIPQWPIGNSIAHLVDAMTTRLAEAGLTLVVHAHPPEARPISDLWKAITPAAVINVHVLDEREQETARLAGIPVVGPSFTVGAGTFGDFQQEIGRRQAEHLAAAGHTRLGFALPDDDRLEMFSRHRLDGVRQVCARLGLPEPDARLVSLGSPAGPRSADSTASAVEHWHRTVTPRVTAVCAYNDEVALAVLADLREHGLAAPEDLAVIGADDVPAAALAFPPLTTVSVATDAIGTRLAEAVLNVLAGQPPPPGPGPEAIGLVRRSTA